VSYVTHIYVVISFCCGSGSEIWGLYPHIPPQKSISMCIHQLSSWSVLSDDAAVSVSYFYSRCVWGCRNVRHYLFDTSACDKTHPSKPLASPVSNYVSRRALLQVHVDLRCIPIPIVKKKLLCTVTPQKCI